MSVDFRAELEERLRRCDDSQTADLEVAVRTLDRLNAYRDVDPPCAASR